jgi:outer membrane usher protein
MNVDAYKKKITLSRIACFIALQCALSIHNTALAREYFNPAFLGIDGPGKDLTDLSAFEEGIGQIPGNYHVDVIVNKTSVGLYDIDFVMQKDSQGNATLQPCLSLEALQKFGIRTQSFPQLADGKDCANLQVIPQANAEFVFDRQQLRLSIPQAALNNHARGYVAPERLDEGINALLLNYIQL